MPEKKSDRVNQPLQSFSSKLNYIFNCRRKVSVKSSLLAIVREFLF